MWLIFWVFFLLLLQAFVIYQCPNLLHSIIIGDLVILVLHQLIYKKHYFKRTFLRFSCKGSELSTITEQDNAAEEKLKTAKITQIRRVLVFGDSATGKTSMLNMLTGENVSTGNNVFAYPFETQTYPVVTLNGVQYEFIDTAGLNNSLKKPLLIPKQEDGNQESENDWAGIHEELNAKQVADNLVDFLSRNKDGFNLLVMVHKAGRILENTVLNYELFALKLVGGNVPVILVVSGCEFHKDLDGWVEENGKELEDEFKMSFKCILGTVWATADNEIEAILKTKRELSKEKVLTAFERFASPERRPITKNDFVNFFLALWQWGGSVKRYFSAAPNYLNQLIADFGWSKQQAEMIESEIMSDGGSEPIKPAFNIRLLSTINE